MSAQPKHAPGRVVYELTPEEDRRVRNSSDHEVQRIFHMREHAARTEGVVEDVRRRGYLGRLLIGLMVACVGAVTVFTLASAVEAGPDGLTFGFNARVLLGAFGFYLGSVVTCAVTVVRYTFPLGDDRGR